MDTKSLAKGERKMTTKYGNLAEWFDRRGRRFAERCTNCGACLEACPLFPLTKFADRGPQAVMEKVTELLKGGEVSEEAYDMVYSCTGGCAQCAKACPEGLLPFTVFAPARAKLADAGKAPPSLRYQFMPGHRYHFGSMFSALQIKPSEVRWMKKAPANPEPVDVVFFTGCLPLGVPHIVLETVAILDRMRINFATLAGGGLCCGSAPMLWGDLQAAQSMGQDLVSNIAAFHPKKAVFLCGGCYHVFVGTLPRLISVPFECYEVTEFLAENLERIPFTQKVDKVVTLHDCCSIARGGLFGAPRKLLQAIPGITLVEMEHNRENNLCCGGIANAWRPKITELVRRAPLEEAKATGADIMALTCVGCMMSFVPLAHLYPFEVRSYTSLVAEATGLHYEDRFTKCVSSGEATRVIAEARDYIDANDFSLEEMERILPEYLNRFCLKHSQASLEGF
jgi:Fe-S oxidoreductase